MSEYPNHMYLGEKKYQYFSIETKKYFFYRKKKKRSTLSRAVNWPSVYIVIYHIQPNYCSVRLGFSKLLKKKLAVKYSPNKDTHLRTS